ncbi:MAG: rubrerythrin family protein [Eggerthellaceae bacterium]|nr:rubrerythrin family protein [Eggerthellaceae bacterium]
MAELTRRDMLKGAAVAGAAAAIAGLAGCAAGAEQASSASASSASADAAASASAEASASAAESSAAASSAPASASAAAADATIDIKAVLFKEAGGSNFGIYVESADLHGDASTTDDTLANLNSAMGGETGAFTKYSAFSEAAAAAGFDRIAALFKATAQAEDIHRHLEEKVAQKLDPDAKLPEQPSVSPTETDGNLIAGARGEIYETAEMYPTYIAKAIEERDAESDADRKAALDEAVEVFTRAKLAEAYHAKWYMDAYTTIDTPTDESYWLCETCGFIHKGPKPAKCPICGVTEFTEF